MTTTPFGMSLASPSRFRLHCALDAVRAALHWPARVLKARCLLGQLGAMDDRELRDIGLARQDLRDALAMQPGVDPSLMLQRRARQRHR